MPGRSIRSMICRVQPRLRYAGTSLLPAVRPSGRTGGALSMPRVAVFIDWQNAYKSARSAFNLGGLPNERGNFSPYNLARILAAGNERGASGELVWSKSTEGCPPTGAIRWVTPLIVGKRRPECEKTPRSSYRVCGRFATTPTTRRRRRKKGIDVQLALGVIESLLLGRSDVAIMFTNDSDLAPVVETVCRLRGPDHIETASLAKPPL